MINQYFQVPVVQPMDIRNVPLQPEYCPNLLLGDGWRFAEGMSIRDLNCYSFHDKVFKNIHEANDFCKNAFGKSEVQRYNNKENYWNPGKLYTGKLAFGHFPHDKNEKLPGKSQIWTYAKPGFLHGIKEFVCSCQSSHNNTFIKLKDSSVCPEAKDSQISDSKVCPSEFNIRTICALGHWIFSDA